MQSITSTFVGLLFPHTIEVEHATDQVYFLLYEPYYARYSVKIIGKKSLIEEALNKYDSSWNLVTIKEKKEPLLLIATGVMEQQPTITGYLGRAVEEKFHMVPLAVAVLPCVPLVVDGLKNKVHPEVGPIQFSEGVKEGFFVVNLSLNQDFSLGPEFQEAYNANDELEDFEREILEQHMRNNQNARNDEDEIMSTNNDTAGPANDYYTDDDEPYVPPESFLNNASRFSDVSDNEDEIDSFMRTAAQDLNQMNSDGDSDNESQSGLPDRMVNKKKPRQVRKINTKRQREDRESVEAEYSGAFNYNEKENTPQRKDSNTSDSAYFQDYYNNNFDTGEEPKNSNQRDKGKKRADYRTTIEEVDDETIHRSPSVEVNQRSQGRSFQSFSPYSRQASVATEISISSTPSREWSTDISINEPSTGRSSGAPFQRTKRVISSSSDTRNLSKDKRFKSTDSSETMQRATRPQEIHGIVDDGIRKRGRPRKEVVVETPSVTTTEKGKETRGRPKKQPVPSKQAGAMDRFITRKNT